VVELLRLCPFPAPTCALAEAGVTNHGCGIDRFLFSPMWRKWKVTPGNSYELDISFTGTQLTDWYIWSGENCEGLTLLSSGSSFTGDVTYPFVAADDYVYLELHISFFGTASIGFAVFAP